ncbi:MAG: class I SAM-dependent methyltransferase [Candidatus Binatia bacterium]
MTAHENSPSEPLAYPKKQILEKYEKFAPWYDLVEGVPDLLGLRKLRRRLLEKASGKVLEVAAGSGKNFPHYPRSCQLTAVDLSPAMLAIARKRAEKLGLNVDFEIMDAERLNFADRSFDTVANSLSLCTYPEPLMALQEMARVCRPDGRLLLLEHGRSDTGWLGRWQDKRADRHAEKFCLPVEQGAARTCSAGGFATHNLPEDLFRYLPCD